MSNVKVFIGSPSEANKLAVALQSLLEREATVRTWTQGIFTPNHGTLESVLEAVDGYDFACFLAPPVDTVSSRGKQNPATRDNIILEYGLFLGRLGRNRVFLIHPRGVPLTLPTDLDGITHLDYKPVDKENPAKSVLAPVAQEIQDRIEEHGPKSTASSRRYNPVLERGSVDRVAGLSDAALYFSRKRHGYKEDIRHYILHNEVIPSLYYYATEEGAEFWLSMSSDPAYRFKNNSLRLLRKVSGEIVSAVRENTPDENSIDFISLGSGDGEKDRLLLSKFAEPETASITYYPLDISDKLLVECVKNVHEQALDYARGLKTKAVIGDFINLKLLRSVYEDRSSPNLFSVLGNTFGNTDEANIMQALRDSMYPGDFVLIEINSDLDEVDKAGSFLRDELSLRYACVPIDMLDIKVNVKKADVREEKELSVFQCAKSSATYYSEVKIDGQVKTDVPLAYDHRYPLEEFQEELSDHLDVNVLLAERYGRAAVVLAQKVA